MKNLLLLIAFAVSPTPGHAGPVRPTVDWARGLVIAEGIGLANRHAPNPAVARGPSRRVAEQAARKQLADRVRELPVAGGGKVAAKAGDATIAERLDAAVAHAMVLEAEPETDGAWRVTMAVPIEAVRQALSGPRESGGDTGPAVVVVDGVAAAPAVGWRVGTLDAATVWVDKLPAWAADAPHVTAKAANAGVIEITSNDGIDATPATLFVIVTRR